MRVPPWKVEPGHQEASLAPTAVTTAAMRRQAGDRAVGIQPRNRAIPGAQGVTLPEGDGGVGDKKWARRHRTRRGVNDHGATQMDDPATWEALILLHEDPETRGTGDQSPRVLFDTKRIGSTANRALGVR